MHSGDYCVSYVQTESWVNPGGQPVVVTNGKSNAQWATAVKYGALYGIHTGNTRHWYVNSLSSGGWQWVLIDELNPWIDLGPPPPPSDAEQCAALGGEWNYEYNRCDYINSRSF